MKMNIDME